MHIKLKRDENWKLFIFLITRCFRLAQRDSFRFISDYPFHISRHILACIWFLLWLAEHNEPRNRRDSVNSIVRRFNLCGSIRHNNLLFGPWMNAFLRLDHTRRTGLEPWIVCWIIERSAIGETIFINENRFWISFSPINELSHEFILVSL